MCRERAEGFLPEPCLVPRYCELDAAPLRLKMLRCLLRGVDRLGLSMTAGGALDGVMGRFGAMKPQRSTHSTSTSDQSSMRSARS